MESRGPLKALGGVVTKRLEGESRYKAGTALPTRPVVKKDCVCLTVLTAYVAGPVKMLYDRVIHKSSVSLERALCQRADVASESEGALSGDC